MSIYTDEGYTSRRDYLDSLAEDFGLDKQTVYTLASILGSSEDFDGLVTALEDEADRTVWE
jgi:hypothetical protein